MARPRDIEVTLTLLPTEHGGRSGPAFSGYRPQFYYSGHDWDAVHEYPDTGSVNPGDTVKRWYPLRTCQHLRRHELGLAAQFFNRHGYVLVLIHFLEGFNISRARVDHNEL